MIGKDLTVLIYSAKDADAYANVFREKGFAGRLLIARSMPEAEQHIAEADVLVCAPMPPETLRGARKLKWIQSTWAGVEGWMRQPPPPGIPLTRMHGVFGPWISEWVFGYLLNAWLDVPRARAQQERREWKPFRQGRLFGKTMGIAGTGDIAQDIASRGQAFGMRVLGLSRSGTPAPSFDAVLTDKKAFLSQLDVLVITLPLTRETEHMFGAAELALLPRGAWLMNAGRGKVVDEDALVEALRAGHLGGAILDVFGQEPLPEGHPFWTLPNCWVTPHISGPSVAEECAAVAFANLVRFVNGEPLRGVVDLGRGY